MSGLVIRVAEESDLPYIVSLQNANRESVGHLPTPALAERIVRRTLLLSLLNDEPCGYLLFDCRASILRIPQACIQYDARRRKYGEALVVALFERHSVAAECRVRCAADLEANLFWRSMEFVCTRTIKGGVRRGRLINEWVRWSVPRLVALDDLAIAPAAQVRSDCMYDDTDYMSEAPDGFRDAGVLERIAWRTKAAGYATGAIGERTVAK